MISKPGANRPTDSHAQIKLQNSPRGLAWFILANAGLFRISF